MQMRKGFIIGYRNVGEGQPVFVIAEAGVNHNGRLDLALRLIDAAADAGADAVKFQTFKAEQVVSAGVPMAAYQKKNLKKSESQLKMVRALELNDEKNYPRLIAHAKKRGIIFFSAPHGGIPSADLLNRFKVPLYKIASPDLTNLPLLRHVARFGKPMIISTGMATPAEITEAVREIKKAGNKKVIVLQCTTNYPLEESEVNLRAMDAIQKISGCLVGYSDHTLGTVAPVAAVARGACVIEKHLTLDTKMHGPDHIASLPPQEFARMVRDIRSTERMLGSSEKTPTASERKIMPVVRKSVIALRDIRKGEAFTEKNLGVKRPGSGLHPRVYFTLLGKKAKRALRADELLTKRDL